MAWTFNELPKIYIISLFSHFRITMNTVSISKKKNTNYRLEPILYSSVYLFKSISFQFKFYIEQKKETIWIIEMAYRC